MAFGGRYGYANNDTLFLATLAHLAMTDEIIYTIPYSSFLNHARTFFNRLPITREARRYAISLTARYRRHLWNYINNEFSLVMRMIQNCKVDTHVVVSAVFLQKRVFLSPNGPVS